MNIIDLLSEFNADINLSHSELYSYWYSYIKQYPILYKLLEVDNQEQNLIDENVFIPVLTKLSKIQDTKDLCIKICNELANKLKLYFPNAFNIILYFGNGSGAGWYSYYDNKPSILLGIENILILNWNNESSIRALISHEFGHLLHEYYRNEKVECESINNHAANILYSEGFAQYFESIMIQSNIFPELEEGNDNFNNFVLNNLKDIAKEYLNRIKKNSIVKEFYGSWYKWNNYRQIGYYLGYFVTAEMQKNMSLKHIAKLPEDEYIKYITNVLTTAST